MCGVGEAIRPARQKPLGVGKRGDPARRLYLQMRGDMGGKQRHILCRRAAARKAR